MIDLFEECRRVSVLLDSGNIAKARTEVIKILDACRKNNIKYTGLLNHLIREVGLFPYIDRQTADWNDAFASNMFNADTGSSETATLHIEQAHILKELLKGESIAVSAPTSFGKSYIIDAFISMRKPCCVVIIVPTVALADETRRRLAKKFSNTYSIITTVDQPLGDRNIFVFPQERAFSYIGKIEGIDILIVDEFYKAGLKDDDRASRLLSIMVELSKISKQRYYLGPNIDSLAPNPFTQGLKFIKEDEFRTVVTMRKSLFKTKSNSETLSLFKERNLLNIISEGGKSLVYTSSHPNVQKVCAILKTKLPQVTSSICMDFCEWLAKNYGTSCYLIPLISRGVGVHNGNLHRSLAQIQIKLFEEREGLSTIVSTSSIIEGVNTQAEKVILWNNKISNNLLDYFTYKNIAGRAGRMLKYFIGYVYLLEEPPKKKETQLDLQLDDEVICSLEEDDPGIVLNLNQKNKLAKYNSDLQQILGAKVYKELKETSSLKGASPKLILRLAQKIKSDPTWPKDYSELLGNDTYKWRTPISQMFELAYGKNSAKNVNLGLWAFSYNWTRGIQHVASILAKYNIGEADMFKLERDINYKVPNILSIVHAIKSALYPWTPDIRNFISQTSNVFLPKNVFILEEYGLPRMISRKIHQQGIIDLEDGSKSIEDIINQFKQIGEDNLICQLKGLLSFDQYIIHYFYDGI